MLLSFQDILLYAETSFGVIGVARSVDGVHYQVTNLYSSHEGYPNFLT